MGIAEMTKPFDREILKAELMAQGLPVLEDTVEKLLTAFFAWTNKSGEIHTNPIVKGVVPAIVGVVQPLAMGYADKIDGVVG